VTATRGQQERALLLLVSSNKDLREDTHFVTSTIKWGDGMIFVSLGKFRGKPTNETTAHVSKMMQEFKDHGNKILGFYWTLGRYDTVLIFEAPNEKVAMEMAIEASEGVTTETMVAVKREEAIKLV
jgi:uncharacterized protein with GYD domain